MNPFKFQATLLVLSSAFLSLGALLLRIGNLVPLPLTYFTYVAVVGLLTVAYYTWNEKFTAVTIGTLLAVISIIFNSLQPAHTSAILHPFVSIQLEFIVIADIAGFYIVPAVYLVYYLARYRKLRTFSALAKIHS